MNGGSSESDSIGDSDADASESPIESVLDTTYLKNLKKYPEQCRSVNM